MPADIDSDSFDGGAAAVTRAARTVGGEAECLTGAGAAPIFNKTAARPTTSVPPNSPPTASNFVPFVPPITSELVVAPKPAAPTAHDTPFHILARAAALGPSALAAAR